MGSHVWTREGTDTGLTQKRGTAKPKAPPLKRKANVWKRGDSPALVEASVSGKASGAGEGFDGSDEAKRRRLEAKGRLQTDQSIPTSESHQGGTEQGVTEASKGESTSHSRQQNGAGEGATPNGGHANGRGPPAGQRASATAKHEALAAEAAELRRKIEEQEARIAEAKAAAERKEADMVAAQKAKRKEQELRKSRLDAGFAEAFRETRELAASAKAPRAAAADDVEVRRVLAAKSDHEVMQLKPGTSRAAIKKKYREMTLALHPDKCKVEAATDAFQRLVHAYQGVLKFAR